MLAIKTTAPVTALRRSARVAALAAASAGVAASVLVPHHAHAAEQAETTHAGTAATATTTALPTSPEQVGKDVHAMLVADKSHAKGGDDEGRGAHYKDGKLVPIPHDAQPEPVPASHEDIDRWINKALEVMHKHDIPGTYDGIYRNLMRESSGDPHTINMWDENAQKNIPSKGLLQVIDPTFEQYHVDGTSNDIYDPVANIVAACNYAADRYGSMDNVDQAY
ncbi:transglycosylase SLT domain-containing protein [Streptomyces hoynatensis]|uniref:Transglycosylase SLT domain-containing protein n=1 Tax=Streptomyces hoynatensis TaxID=1141874 RepID=A0A3A9YWP0_9ACTN|nr:transglycosylase SLT domain-containing protein [Streptomyces hoynatensis]RKN40375.1 hypothetical protein D7294_18130 [Streptomyces hoynatensis]